MKKQVWYTELNERVEDATSGYSITDDSLQCIHSVPVSKYCNIRSRCLVHEFPVTDIF